MIVTTVIVCTLSYHGWFPPFTASHDEYFVVRSVARCEQLSDERDADWAKAMPLSIAGARIQCGPHFEDCPIDAVTFSGMTLSDVKSLQGGDQ